MSEILIPAPVKSKLLQARIDPRLIARLRAYAASLHVRPCTVLSALLDTYLPPMPTGEEK